MKLALVTDEPDFEQLIRTAASGLPAVDVVRVTLAELPEDPSVTLDELVAAGGDVIFVGPEANFRYVADLARLCDVEHPEIGVVLVAPESPAILADALHAGIREVVDPGLGTADVERVLTRLATRSASLRRNLQVTPAVPDERSAADPGRIVAIVSPKGGTGKTTLAVNAAVSVAQRSDARVVLVDLDPFFGDVAFCLGLQPALTGFDAVRHRGDFRPGTLDAYLTAHRSGLKVLAAPADLFQAEAVTGERVVQIITALSIDHDLVILDTATGIGDLTISALEVADEMLACGTADLSGLVAIRRFIHGLSAVEAVPRTSALVLNRWPERAGPTVQEIQQAVGLPVRAVIPDSPQITASAMEGTVAVEAAPRSPVARLATEIAKSLVLTEFTPSSAAGRRGFLRRGR